MSALNYLKGFFQDERGLTVVEYVIGAGLMLVAMTALFTAFGDILVAEMNSMFIS